MMKKRLDGTRSREFTGSKDDCDEACDAMMATAESGEFLWVRPVLLAADAEPEIVRDA